jgi:mannose-6-phosphate isomerase class I
MIHPENNVKILEFLINKSIKNNEYLGLYRTKNIENNSLYDNFIIEGDYYIYNINNKNFNVTTIRLEIEIFLVTFEKLIKNDHDFQIVTTKEESEYIINQIRNAS